MMIVSSSAISLFLAVLVVSTSPQIIKREAPGDPNFDRLYPAPTAAPVPAPVVAAAPQAPSKLMPAVPSKRAPAAGSHHVPISQ